MSVAKVLERSINASGTCLYSANETAGAGKVGTVSAFAVIRPGRKLKLVNTVQSGGAGPTYVSIHPSGRFLFVANYFGGSVAALPILADGRLGAATDVKKPTGKIGPHNAASALPGSFAFSGHDRTRAHMIAVSPPSAWIRHRRPRLHRLLHARRQSVRRCFPRFGEEAMKTPTFD
jgi:6-phosphogluconolactonase